MCNNTVGERLLTNFCRCCCSIPHGVVFLSGNDATCCHFSCLGRHADYVLPARNLTRQGTYPPSGKRHWSSSTFAKSSRTYISSVVSVGAGAVSQCAQRCVCAPPTALEMAACRHTTAPLQEPGVAYKPSRWLPREARETRR